MEGLSKSALKHAAESSGPKQLTGRTPTDHIVVFDGNPRLIGRMVQVRIEEASAFTLFGRVETDEHIGATGEVEAIEEATLPIEVVGRMSLPLA